MTSQNRKIISPNGAKLVEIPEIIKSKYDFIQEIVLEDSGHEISNRKNEIRSPKKEELFSNGKGNTRKYEKFFTKNNYLRGLLPPKGNKSYLKTLKHPVVKRCCIEHSYFMRYRSGSFRYNFRYLPATSSTTLLFENNVKDKQPTVDVECFASKRNSVSGSDSFKNKNNVIGKRKRNSFGGSSSSSSRSRSNSSSGDSGRDSSPDDSNDRDYFPEGNSTESDGDTESIVDFDSSRNKKTRVIKNASDQTNSLELNKRFNNKFYKVEESSERIKNMQKLLKAKCASDKGKLAKISPPRLKKMISKRKDENILKMTEYLFPIPNLTKIPNGEKNWRMEYMDDEVQSLGLDDLLLKASELNAENFTKALGRKLEPVKSNYNAKDSSEIVFTIPKSKKQSEEVGENDGELSKRVNVKTVKLDISKPFFESEKEKETESATKSFEETTPKRLGIKVKTVENINEEFKDSLGRLKTQNAEKELENNFGVAKESDLEKREESNLEKDGEGSQPFIMTIIQSNAEKPRPAILRNSYLKKKGNSEKTKSQNVDCLLEGEPPPGVKSKKEEKPEENSEILMENHSLEKNTFGGENDIPYSNEMENDSNKSQENRFTVKKRNIPFILSHGKKPRQSEVLKKSKLVKDSSEKQPTEKSFKITSMEQKLGPKETNKRFIKVVPYEPFNKGKQEQQQKLTDDDESDSPQKDGKSSHVLSLSAFSAILKEILPDRWFLSLDKKYGLQIIKTYMDEMLNPSILISVVITRCGRLTVNVRGKQLNKSHELFSNLCDISNSENKLSLNYILAILNKLRHRSVCCGCDDPALKKYWSDGGVVENQTEFQQVYRSHLCQLLVSLGRRRCYPCYRMNESIKKRHRRDKLEEKVKEDKEKDSKDVPEETPNPTETPKTRPQSKGVKRNLEDFLEESFSTMKQQIVDEIEKNKKLGERENALKAQEEVLSFMGLTRKESLDNPVRKSKRKKNSFYKLQQQQPVKKKIDQKELEFLEKYWTDINTLFSTSLLFGAYSRTGRGRLREKCRMFQKLLSTWKNIITTNPEWIGEISFSDDLTEGNDSLDKDSNIDQFEKMDVPALRAYIINSVKEVNRIKHKLRTRNSYFKVLYNKFVKRRMKRPKTLSPSPSQKGNGSSNTSTTNTPTMTDLSSDENSRDKDKDKDKDKEKEKEEKEKEEEKGDEGKDSRSEVEMAAMSAVSECD